MARTRDTGNEPPSAIDLPALTPFGKTSLEAHADYEATAFVGLDFSDQRATDATFMGCRFERCRFDGASLQRARLAECFLSELGALALDLTDSVWRDSLVAGGRFGALTAAGATWTSVRVRGARINFADFSGAKLHEVAFEDCVLGELDLSGAQLRSVSFTGSTIEQLDLDDARLSAVDLSHATVLGLRGVKNLRGAIVSRDQLVDMGPLLAAYLGFEVRDR